MGEVYTQSCGELELDEWKMWEVSRYNILVAYTIQPQITYRSDLKNTPAVCQEACFCLWVPSDTPAEDGSCGLYL